MRKTGVLALCSHCSQEFEIFSDDGTGDRTAIWNWCPHCGKKNMLWLRFIHENEKIPLGISCEEARKKFPELKRQHK